MMIGQEIAITEARNPQIVGIRGRIIDETKHTLTINTSKGNKTIIKDQIEETE